MVKLHKKLSDRIDFIGVNVGINERTEGVRKYIKTEGMSFPNIFDKNRKVINSFGVMGTPTNIVIDRKGIVRYRGTDAPDDLEKHMKELLD